MREELFQFLNLQELAPWFEVASVGVVVSIFLTHILVGIVVFMKDRATIGCGVNELQWVKVLDFHT